MSTPSKGTYSCSTCGNTYQRKNHLVRHQGTHSVVPHHRCQACRKRFSRSDLLRKHYGKCSQRKGNDYLPILSRGPRRKACDNCFRKKVVCDNKSPCQHCELRELQCTYLRSDARTDGPSVDEAPAPQNAGFFVKITDPIAANMWRSFPDDDAPQITSNSAGRPLRALNLELLVEGEWESFPQDMDGFTFAPMEEDMNDGYIPVFKREMRRVLQEKSASAVQSLCALHNSLQGSDPSYNGAFDKTIAEEAFSPDSIIRFAAVYFHRKYHHMPVINRHSFGSQDTSVALLLAVSLAGALQSPPQDDALALVSLARLIEEYAFFQLAEVMATTLSSRPSTVSLHVLETVQAGLLLSNVLLLVNDVLTRKRIRMRLQPALVSVVRQLGFFSSRHSAFVNETQYIQEEMYIRIAHWTAIGDWYHSVMFYLPPLITISEVTGDLPDATGVWSAENALGSNGQQRVDPGVKPPGCIRDIIHALTQDELFDPASSNLCSLSSLNLHFIVLGLFSMLVSSNLMGTTLLVAPSMEKALRRWFEVWRIAVSNTPPIVMKTSGIERYSEEQYWAARRMLQAMVLPNSTHSYLRRVGHDSLAEFHAFLVQSQRTNA